MGHAGTTYECVSRTKLSRTQEPAGGGGTESIHHDLSDTETVEESGKDWEESV